MGRFRITWIMGLIGVVALELAGLRALSDLVHRAASGGSTLLAGVVSALMFGAVPMANVVAIGLLVILRRGGRFLPGFVAFGATALAIYIAGVVLFPAESGRFMRDRLAAPLISHLMHGDGYLTTGDLLVLYPVMIGALALPQLAFALFGGLVFHATARRTPVDPVP